MDGSAELLIGFVPARRHLNGRVDFLLFEWLHEATVGEAIFAR